MSATIGILALGVTAFFVLVALITWASAPAVTISAMGGLLGGGIVFLLGGSNGPHGVPLAVGAGASLGVVLGAGVGIATTRRRAPGTWPMWRWAVWFLVAAPLFVATLLMTALDACPLYNESRRAGYCHNDVDLVGDWISGVSVLFAFDLLVWVVLLWFAPGTVREPPAGDEGSAPTDDRRAQLIVTVGAIGVGLIAVAAWSFPPTPDVVGMSPTRAVALLSAAGFDLESGYLSETPEDLPRRCGDVPRHAGEHPARGPDTCVLGMEPRLGFLGRAGRGTAVVLYVGGPDERPRHDA